MTMTESWDTIDRYLVISSDTHAGADLRDYKAYLPSTWHEEFDAWADSYRSPFDDLVHATAHRNWDSDFRLSEMDADGVAAEVLIPNTVPPFFPTTMVIVVGLPKTKEEFERRWVGTQAHNRWVVDFVSQAPARRKGLLQIFPNDVDAAVEEIKWAKQTGAFGGGLLVPVPPGHVVPPFFHECYEPLWRICEELDFPLALHNATVPDMPMDQPASNTLAMIKFSLWNKSTLIDMIVGGVFERFPGLKLVPTENGIRWVLETAALLDAALPPMKSTAQNRTMPMFGGSHVDTLKSTALEYVQRNLWFAISGHSANPGALSEGISVDRIMWGSDYPHEEGTTPQSNLGLRWVFADTAEADTRKMLAGNIAGLYGFDLDALVPVAKRIGPKVADVHTPVTAADLTLPVNEMMRRPFPGGSLLERSRAADSKF
jgi:predicted TIM-barrel fold metal-dependent hydrolase